MPFTKTRKVSGTKCPACSYSTEFRCRIYEINPHDLSCMYKIMFEACAVNALFELDNNYKTGRICREKFDTACPSPPAGIDTQKPGTPDCCKSESVLQSVCQEKWLSCWDSCQYPHGASTICKNSIIKKDIRSKSLSMISKFDSSPGIKEDTNRNAKYLRRASSTSGVARLTDCSTTSFHPNQNRIEYEFKHYDDIRDYIVQYRHDHTYKRLQMLKPGYFECGGISPRIQRLSIYDGKQQLTPPSPPSARKNPTSVNYHNAYECKQPSVPSSPSPERTSPTCTAQKRSSNSTQTPESSPPQSSRQTAENDLLNMGFDYSLTNMYTTPAFKPRMFKEDTKHRKLIVTSPKFPTVFHSRPTIPSNNRGQVYQSFIYLVPHSGDCNYK